MVYACSWESGQDVSSRFGPQQTGGTIIQHVRPVDLQASMAQGAEILNRWANFLASAVKEDKLEDPVPADYAADAVFWQSIANEFTVKTRLMWQDGETPTWASELGSCGAISGLSWPNMMLVVFQSTCNAAVRK